MSAAERTVSPQPAETKPGMSKNRRDARIFRFGVFELDFKARELRRKGLRVKLQERPFQILEMLLERPGELVTRKDLRERLWPDTFVQFDRSLNTAINSLRQALGDSSRNPRFLETRSGYGYRFIAPVESIPLHPTQGSGDNKRLDSIAILPFHNASGDPELEYLSDGISEALIATLSQLPDVRVMARTTVFRYKGREIHPQVVGHDLNVRALLTGEVMLRSDALMIAAELVDTATGWRLWGEQYHRKVSDIIAIQEEISREIASKLRSRLTMETRQGIARRATGNSEAYRDYLRGQYHINRSSTDSLAKGIAHFERAVQQDPDFALPYAGLSHAFSLLAYFGISPSGEVMPKAEQAARKALEIDQTLTEAHVALAGVLKSYHWDWQASEAGYKVALELSPNYALGHRMYGDLLSGLGRKDQALKEMECALDLDPLSLIINMELAWVLYMSRDYPRAHDQALNTIEMDHQFSPAYHALGLAYEQMGRPQEAVQTFQKASDASGGNPIALASLAHALAAGGRRPEARKILVRMKELAKRSYVPPYAFAIVSAGLGDKLRSLGWLQKAFEEHDVWLVWILQDPRLDLLRKEPGFRGLVHQMGLPRPN